MGFVMLKIEFRKSIYLSLYHAWAGLRLFNITFHVQTNKKKQI